MLEGGLEKVWPRELLYWRRMGSKEISDYLDNTPKDKRLVLIPWGVLEAHGPWLPVAMDSIMAQITTDMVAARLYHNHQIQPVIFNSVIDIGSYSATRDLPGAVAVEGWQEYKSGQPSPILQIWEEVIKRLKREGFDRYLLVNGDGGNWMNYMERGWEEDFRPIKKDIEEKYEVIFDGSNWDQEGGESWRHGGHHEHAFIRWACEYAPEFVRLSAIRAGAKPAPEEKLAEIGEVDPFAHLTSEERRQSNWADYPQQQKLRAISKFSFKGYKRLLYEQDGKTPLKEGGIASDFEAKIDNLMEKVVRVF